MPPDPVPSDLVVPRYGERSLAEVVPALLAALGVPSPGDGPDALAVPPVRAAGLLLVDGLGADLLRRYAADAPFLAGLPDVGPLTAGFPSSTATSLTSLGTGTPPGAHGIVGITMRVGSSAAADAAAHAALDRPPHEPAGRPARTPSRPRGSSPARRRWSGRRGRAWR